MQKPDKRSPTGRYC